MPAYPKGYGKREYRKALTNLKRRADDREIQAGVERQHSVPAKKDTRHWCKGHVGLPHQPEWVKWFAFRNATWYKRTCQVCGKVLAMESREA